MLKKIIFLLLVMYAGNSLYAQIPAGKCGLLYTYDAAGNRIKQEYFCNNTKSTAVPGTILTIENTSFVEVEALYPNPTTGKCYIVFSTELTNVPVMVTDMNGRTVQALKGNGTRLDIDLSGVAPGTYIINIYTGKESITQKIVKQ